MSKGAPEDWFGNEILDGLMMLKVLNMPFSPSEDTVEAMALAWINALWHHHRAWNEQLDTGCIQKAFHKLMISVDKFPTPAQFLYYLPDREYKDLALPKPVVSDEERQAVLARVREEMMEVLR